MRRWFRYALLMLVLVPGAGRAQDDAYLDAGARTLVEQARERRRVFDTAIQRYSAVAQERISAGLNTLGRERLLFRRETATRIDWQREGPVNIEVLGGREVIPVVFDDIRLPGDIDAGVAHLAFDPIGNEIFLLGMDSDDPDESFRHPLAEGSEQHYRFRSGDTTTIRLPDGRQVRLLELVVIPRRQDARLLSGSFWIDEATHGLVQAIFRIARPWELGIDGADEDEDHDDVPGFLRPIRADVSYVTIEYALWDLQWWLPRLIAAEGWFQAGSMLRMPLRYERRYGEYEVVGDPSAPQVTDIEEARPCRPPMRLTINIGSGGARDTASVDTLRNPVPETAEDSAALACERRYVVSVPTDTANLIANEYLPGSIYERGETLVSQSELETLKQRVEDLAEAPWQAPRPSLSWGLGGAGLVRYNRVEALSLGAKGALDFGRLTADATARIATGDWQPSLEVGINRETPNRNVRVAAYRRLDNIDRESGGLGTGNSLNAVLFGRDDGDYFRATGGELLVSPSPVGPRWYDLRLYAEQQRAVDVETDFSVRHLFNDEHVFRANLQAARAEQFGGELTLRIWRGYDPDGFRWGGHIGARGETGDFGYARFRAGLETTFPLPFGAVAALGGAAGTSTGDVPTQGLWLLGGPATLRGYDGAAALGEAFWRGRAEIARGIPAARIALFSDVGWAGARSSFEQGRPLVSAGVGLSFLDGIVRADLARALRGKTGWRFDLYINGTI